MRDRLRHALLIAAAVSGFAIFGAFAVYEEPGLGLGHFFYVPIILAALATGPAISAGAAVIATAMYASGVIINSDVSPSEVFTTSTGIRFVTFVTVGIVTGYFAKRNRTLLAELRLLADRDALTGLPNTRVFERAIGERLVHEQPFGLIVGCVDELASGIDADDVLRQVASRLLHSLGSAGDAGKTATHLQALLAADGFAVSFGWAAYPQDGSNALSLYRAADERLYARRIVHRHTTVVALRPSATSA
jgi:GGDEF domain-containing protein